jgi:hypothetical protein
LDVLDFDVLAFPAAQFLEGHELSGRPVDGDSLGI